MRLVLASNNAKKLSELKAMLAGLPVELVPQGALGIAEAEEPHHTFIEGDVTLPIVELAIDTPADAQFTVDARYVVAFSEVSARKPAPTVSTTVNVYCTARASGGTSPVTSVAPVATLRPVPIATTRSSPAAIGPRPGHRLS